MKHITKSILATVALLAAFASCQKSESNATLAGDDMTISINASISRADDSESTVSKTVFEHDDQVSMFAWTGTLDYANLVINNAILRLNYDAWVTSSEIEWKNTTTTHTIAAIYPATDEDNYQMLSEMTYVSGTDMLYSNVSLTPQAAAVDLEFSHMMSLLEIELIYSNFDNDDILASSIIISALDNATINYYSGEISTESASKKDLDLSLENNTSLARIMVPQSGINDIVMNIDGKQYVYSGDDIDLLAGHYTKCTFTINKHFYDISLGEVSVTPWSKDSGSDFDFTVEE